MIILIDRAEVKKELEKQFLGFIAELENIQKLDNKIECKKPMIKDLKAMIKHSVGIHKILLKWHIGNVENTMIQAEILQEILTKKFQNKST